MKPKAFDRSTLRRVVALLCIVAGALLMLLAPATWAGILLLVFGVSIEVIGFAISRR